MLTRSETVNELETNEDSSSLHPTVCSTIKSTPVEREAVPEAVPDQFAHRETTILNEQSITSTEDVPVGSVTQDVEPERTGIIINGHTDYKMKKDGGLDSGAVSSLPLFYEQVRYERRISQRTN